MDEVCVFPRWGCCVIFPRETGTHVPNLEPQRQKKEVISPQALLVCRLVKSVGNGLVTHRCYGYPLSQQRLCALAGRRHTLPLGNPVNLKSPSLH